MKALLQCEEAKKNVIYGERYNIRNVGIRDSFSINKYFILIIALEQFTLSGFLKKTLYQLCFG